MSRTWGFIYLAFTFIILSVFLLMATSLFIKLTNLPFIWGTVFLAFLGSLLLLCNVFLSRFFINKKAPGVLELDEAYGRPMKNGEYLWEKTAGTGIVPKWVSWIGISSYACFAGILVWLIIWLG
jgi:hypothetical protein